VTENIHCITDLAKEQAKKKKKGDAEDADEDEDGDDEEDQAALDPSSHGTLGAQEVFDRLTDFKFVAGLFFLTDLMEVVNMVATSFQSDLLDTSVTFVSDQIGLLKKHIGTYTDRSNMRWQVDTAKFLRGIEGMEGRSTTVNRSSSRWAVHAARSRMSRARSSTALCTSTRPRCTSAWKSASRTTA